MWGGILGPDGSGPNLMKLSVCASGGDIGHADTTGSQLCPEVSAEVLDKGFGGGVDVARDVGIKRSDRGHIDDMSVCACALRWQQH